MLNTFVSQNNKEPLVCAMSVTVFVGDPLLRERKDYGGPTISLEQAQKKLAHREEAEDEEEQPSISYYDVGLATSQFRR